MKLFESEVEDLKIILKQSGQIITYYSIVYFIQAVISLLYKLIALFSVFLFLTLFSLITAFVFKRFGAVEKKGNLSHAFLSLTLAWCFITLVGAVPFLAALPVLDSLFESTAAVTTTSFTMLPNPASTEPLLLLWRSLENISGALLFIIGFLAVSKGRKEEETVLIDRMKSFSKGVLKVYLYAAVIGAFLFFLSGLDLFSSLNYVFSSLSTAGSSIRGSIGVVANERAYLISTVLVMIGATNVLLLIKILGGNLDEIYKNAETKTFIWIFLLGAVVISLTSSSFFPDFYHFISAATTSGFMLRSPAELKAAGELYKGVLILAMLTGGAVYSSAGGIKLHRVYLLLKSLFWRIKEFSPDTKEFAKKVHNIEDFAVHDEDVIRAGNLVLSYLLLLMLSSLFLASQGYSLGDSVFESASALSNTGLSVGIISPDSTAGAKLLFIFEMLAGRLEFLMFLISVYYFSSKIKVAAIGR